MAPLVALMGACGGQDAPKKVSRAEKTKADPGVARSDEAENEPGAGAWSWSLPKGMPEPEVPADNPMSAAKVELGHKLFMDKRLSVDGTRSCYSCHQNELGNADGREKALGPGNKLLARNTPTIWNVGYHKALYWDGRAPSLEKQAIGALKGGNMGLGDGLAAKAKEIGGLAEYEDAFKQVFGADEVTPDHVAQALSAYERTLVCGDTAYDKESMSKEAQRGWRLFSGKANCISCHTGPNFTDGDFHNTGVGAPADRKAGEGVDIGRGKISKTETDNFKFRTPTLRNSGKTAPYFHDGSAKTLVEAVTFMAKGGNRDVANLDTLLRDAKLSDEEVADLVAFIEALDCPGTLEVIGDQAAPGITSPL